MTVPNIKKLKELKKQLQEAKEVVIKSKDNYSAPPKQVDRKDGVGAADKKWEAKQVPQGNTKPTTRKEGAGAADKKWEAKQVDQNAGIKPVARAEGAAAAEQDWHTPEKFRAKLRAELGLPLNDKLNAVGKGLNESVKK